MSWLSYPLRAVIANSPNSLKETEVANRKGKRRDAPHPEAVKGKAVHRNYGDHSAGVGEEFESLLLGGGRRRT